MKVLVSADWHLGLTTHGIIGDDGVNTRITDAYKVVEQIASIAVDEKVDMVIHCGDVFHTNRPGVQEQLIFLDFLHAMEHHSITTRVIIGNHDYNSRLGAKHALALFQKLLFKHVKIYGCTDSEDIDGHLFYYFPYGATPPSFDTRGSESTTLVCHSHLEGAVVGAEPFEIKDDKATKWKDLPVDFVFAGHFHKPQTLSHQAPLAFYPGSLQPIDFNERLDKKRICLVDLNARDVGHMIGSKLLNTRKLVQIIWPFTEEIENVNDAIVKVDATMDESEAHKFDENKMREVLMSEGAYSIASINLHIRRSVAKRDPEINLDHDIMSNFKKYIAGRDLGDLSDDVEIRGKEIIQGCES